MGHVHHQWLEQVSEDMRRDYDRLHADAVSPALVQQAGHGAESSWVRFLSAWLPPEYEVGRRKYIVPEKGSSTFETDLVVFRPSYPVALREREEILASGVAAAFSVKLTLDRAGLSEAARSATALTDGMAERRGSPRTEMQRPFPFGVLAHSHSWKAPASAPAANINDAVWTLDHAHADRPAKSLDLVCVADLGTWRRVFMPRVPTVASLAPGQTPSYQAVTAMIDSSASTSPAPVAVLVSALFERLAADHPTMRPLADGLRLTGTSGEGSGLQRVWALQDVFSDEVRSRLLSGGWSTGDPDWLGVL